MHKILMLTAGLLVSMPVLGAGITDETCANNSGRILIGAVTGHKYCLSKKGMNWWNAHTWCEGQGRQLFDMNDCANFGTTGCPELNVDYLVYVNTATPKSPTEKYVVRLNTGSVTGDGNGNLRGDVRILALCK